MDFHALSRRELQALCKRNAIRANMSNAAMADALRSLPSVEGIDEIRMVAAPPGVPMVKSAEEVAGEEQRHGRPHPGGGRSQATTRSAEARKTDEVATASATFQRSQSRAARDATASEEAEAVSTGKRRTRRSRRSKVKMDSDQKEEEAAAAQKEPIEPILFETKSTDEVSGGDQQHGYPLLRGGRGRATRRRAAMQKTEVAALAPDTSQDSKMTAANEEAVAAVEVEAVSAGKRRTRRSRRSKVNASLEQKEEVAAAAPKELKAGSSDARIGFSVTSDKSYGDPKEEAVLDEEATKPQECEMHYQNPSICSAKRRTRRFRRSKVKMASGQKEEVAVAARKELIADSSDVAIGSAVVSDKSWDDLKEKKLVMVEEVGARATNFQKGTVQEQVPTSTVQRSASLASMENLPVQSVLSNAELRVPVIEVAQDVSFGLRVPVIEMAQDVSFGGAECFAEASVGQITDEINREIKDKAAEKSMKEFGFTLTGVADQSNLLVNTLDKFAKPMYKFTVKEEKASECWWMLM